MIQQMASNKKHISQMAVVTIMACKFSSHNRPIKTHTKVVIKTCQLSKAKANGTSNNNNNNSSSWVSSKPQLIWHQVDSNSNSNSSSKPSMSNRPTLESLRERSRLHMVNTRLVQLQCCLLLITLWYNTTLMPHLPLLLLKNISKWWAKTIQYTE